MAIETIIFTNIFFERIGIVSYVLKCSPTKNVQEKTLLLTSIAWNFLAFYASLLSAEFGLCCLFAFVKLRLHFLFTSHISCKYFSDFSKRILNPNDICRDDKSFHSEEPLEKKDQFQVGTAVSAADRAFIFVRRHILSLSL